MANQYYPTSRLQWFRRQHNLTQNQLAEIIGVTLRTVQRWESGESTPSGYARKKICRYFGATSADLGFFTNEQVNKYREEISESETRLRHRETNSVLPVHSLARSLLMLILLLAVVIRLLFSSLLLRWLRRVASKGAK